MKHKFIDTKGIKFKIIISFLFVLAIVFLMTWLLEYFLYDRVFRNVMSREVVLADEEIVSVYTNSTESLDSYLEEKNCSVVVFKMSGASNEILYSSSKSPLIDVNQLLNAMLYNLSYNTSVRYYSKHDEYERFTCGRVCEIDGEEVFFYVSAIVTPSNSTIRVLTFLLLWITIAGLIVALMVSIYFSRSLSKPIQNISNKAKMLSGGNLDIEFDSHEFTEISQLSDTLNYSIGEIKKSDEIRKEIIQNVSHELRTPLTMIKSYTELIEDFSGDNPVKRKEHLDIIKSEAEKLEKLVSDMIDLSKLQTKTMSFDMREFDISECMKKFEQYYTMAFKSSGFVFDFSYPKEAKIVGDSQRIEQAIVNLINNAINYSKDNKKIEVVIDKNQNGFFQLDVIDHGVGISEEDLPKIFERHFRSVNSSRTTAGSGVGLTVAKEILDCHGFEYGVKSEIGKGSDFYIEFTQNKDINNNTTIN